MLVLSFCLSLGRLYGVYFMCVEFRRSASYLAKLGDFREVVCVHMRDGGKKSQGQEAETELGHKAASV